jgi:hypothetical protein
MPGSGDEIEQNQKQNDKGRRRFAVAVLIHNERKNNMTKEQKEREKMYEEYRQLGMSEEAIKAIREFDDQVAQSNKDYEENTISIEDLRRRKKERRN